MTIDNRAEYINYRFRRAEEALEEALILAEKGKWNAVVNRLYYSCFYAVIALLLKNDIETHSHDGTRTQFSLYFVKTDKIDKKYGKLLTRLFDFRQKGDYGDLFVFDEKIAAPLIDQVKEFLTEIKKHID